MTTGLRNAARCLRVARARASRLDPVPESRPQSIVTPPVDEQGICTVTVEECFEGYTRAEAEERVAKGRCSIRPNANKSS